MKSALVEKRDLYLRESVKLVDEYGWCRHLKCDGLLFNCLWSIAGAPVDIMQAREHDGKWHRHPSMQCYQLGQSKSEISRDMFDGLHLWALQNKRSDVVCDLIKYGEKNSWIMGYGDISRTYFTPSMQATLYEIRHHLTGKSSWKRRIPRDWYRPIPFCIPSSLRGYQRHVQVLHVLANCMMRPASTREIDLLAYYTEDQPRNALFHAILHQMTDKRFDDAIDILLDETMFPNDHLPTTENYDSHYLWQRDMSSSDWRPRSSERQQITLPAIDWLFAAKITLGGLLWEI